MEVHLKHLRRVFEVMRANNLYADIDKRSSAALSAGSAYAPIQGSQGHSGLADPEVALHAAELMIKSRDEDITALSKSIHQGELTASASPGLAGLKQVIQRRCALLQKDDEGRKRVISFQSRQLKAAERNYPVHDKELLTMKYALVKFRAHRLCSRPFPGKLNVLADALSRRPDYELAHVYRVTTDLYDRIHLAYQVDENYTPLARFLSDGKDAKRAQLHRYELADGLLHYRVDPGDPPRVVGSNDEDMKYDILLEAYGAPMSGHLGREKTYQTVSQTFWWPRMYKWVAHNVKTCETCQKVKSSGHALPPLQSLPMPAECWKSMSLDFVFGLPIDDKGNTGILVFVCRLSKMHHLAPVRDKVTGKQAAQLFLDSVFRYHGLPKTIFSDRDPRFTRAFWDTLFQILGTKLTMSTADHPQTDGQTERVSHVLEDTLRSICAEAPWSWSDQLPMVEFALSNAVHASTGFTPFYLNGPRHPQVPLTLRGGTGAFIWGEARKAFSSQVSEIEPESLKIQLSSFIDDRLTLVSRVRDAMASAQDKQKEYSDKHARGNLSVFKEGELVLLDTKNLPLKVVSSVESNKFKRRFIGPFAVLARHGAAYIIDSKSQWRRTRRSTWVALSDITIHWVLLLGWRKSKVRTHLLETRLSPLDNRSFRCRSL
ncbi:LOW QUALITY PROTEIN: Pol protein [Phytophthora palmivora]|uniref:Pol protein n=1 Tax=Phytophthora palmivora TaxID=4796 RepID=A0A2P4X8I2_9STRA|nr:LOW QUALITY PROTEIN: Pol protein [Phytophthora palmivora]